MARAKSRQVARILFVAGSFGLAGAALGADGTWTASGNESWLLINGVPWSAGQVANGAGATAFFNAVDLTTQQQVIIEEPRTIGNLILADLDAGTAGGYDFTSGSLGAAGSTITFAGTTPTINIGTFAAGSVVNLNTNFTGTAGLTKTGVGEVVFNTPDFPVFSGGLNVNGGTLALNMTQGTGTTTTMTGSISVASGATLRLQGGAFNFTLPINLAAGSNFITNIGVGQNAAAPTGLVNFPSGTYNMTFASSGSTFYSSFRGNNTTLNATLPGSGATYSIDRIWSGFTAINFTGTGANNANIRIRPNGGTTDPNNFLNTTVTLTHATMFTNTNSGGNPVNIGALNGTADSILRGGLAGSSVVYTVGSLNTNSEFAGQIETGNGISLVKAGSGTWTLSTAIVSSTPDTGFPAAGISYQPTANAVVGRRGGITQVLGGTLKLTNEAYIPGGINDAIVGDVMSLIDVRAGATFDVSGSTVSGGYSTASRQRVMGGGTIVGNWIHDESTLAPGNLANSAVNATSRETAAAGTLTFANSVSLTGGAIDFDLTPNQLTGSDRIVAVGGANLGGAISLNLGFIGGVSTGEYVIVDSPSVPLTGSSAGWTVFWPGRGTAPAISQTANQVKISVTASSFGTVKWSAANTGTWDTNTTNNWFNSAVGITNPDRFFALDNVKFWDTFDGTTTSNGTNSPATRTVELPGTVQPSSVEFDNSAGDYRIQGVGKITGSTGLVKKGTGLVQLTTTNDYTGGTAIEAGTLEIEAGAIGSGSLTMRNNTAFKWWNNGNVPQTTLLDPNSNVTFSSLTTGGNNTEARFQGSIVGSGTVNLTSDDGTIRSFDFFGDMTPFSGSIKALSAHAVRFRSAASGSLPDVSVDLGDNGSILGSKVDGVSTTYQIGALAGGQTAQLTGHQSGAGGENVVVTWEIGALNQSTTFAGTVSDGNQATGPNSTAITKVGSATLTFSGANSYTGVTRVESGALALGNDGFVSAWLPVTTNAGGADVRGGKLILQYTGTATSPASTVVPLLAAAYASNFATGQIRSSNAVANAIGLGYADDGVSNFVIQRARYGDADLNGTVNITDFALLAANFNQAGPWGKGDFNYDGLVNISDFASLAANFNQSLPIDLPRASVPEPAALGALAAAAGMFLSRRRRR